MAEIDVDALLAPLSDAAPSGADLEYDAAFLALEEASRGKPEQQFGDTVIPAQEPDWRTMREQALDLAGRTRDLRVAMQLLRASTRLDGFAGFASGAALLHGLLERLWDSVYPQLDASDGNDPTMRLNALAPLADAASVLADLRTATLGAARGGITVRQVELAFGKADPHDGEVVPSEAGAIDGIAAASAGDAMLLDTMAAAHAHVRGIEALIVDKVGSADGPDLKALRTITQCLADAAQRVRGDAGEAGSFGAADADGAGAPGARAVSAPGTIASR